MTFVQHLLVQSLMTLHKHHVSSVAVQMFMVVPAQESACPGIHAKSVVRSLNQVVEWRGKPKAIRRNNGPEYIGKTMTEWVSKNRVRLDYTQPGNPKQNAYVERYNRTVRYDWLGHYLFESIDEAQDYATNWMWTYNHERSYMALVGITPKQKLAAARLDSASGGHQERWGGLLFWPPDLRRSSSFTCSTDISQCVGLKESLYQSTCKSHDQPH